MVMYVEDQQGRLLLGKDTAEAGEWMGGFKAPWRCNGDTIHVKYMHKMLRGFKQVKAYVLVLYCMAVFFPTYSLLPSSQKWQFFDCKASATPILNVSTSKKVAWTTMSQTTKPQHFISVEESLITYIHSWVIITECTIMIMIVQRALDATVHANEVQYFTQNFANCINWLQVILLFLRI